MAANKHNKLDAMRLKDMVCQLSDVIFLLCDAKGKDTMIIFDQFTNITKEELDALNIVFPKNNYSKNKTRK